MMPNEAQPTIARFPRAATAAYTALVLLFALGTGTQLLIFSTGVSP
jgi:hypothetical protein